MIARHHLLSRVRSTSLFSQKAYISLTRSNLQSFPILPDSFQQCRLQSTAAVTAVTADDQAIRRGLRLRLDLHAEQLIDDHREGLRRVLQAVRSLPEATSRDVKLVESEIARLGDGFFMLVVAGEYNAGKSSLINALLGKNVLAEGPTPTTSEVTKLKFADASVDPVFDESGVLVRGEPVEVLASRLQIVDTPGTNAINRGHEALTRDFLPLCDVVLFVTSADRPFSESERVFLESIRTWGKKVILIVNKIDLLDTEEERNEVMRFVSSSARSLLGSKSRLFALSARLAKQAKDSAGNTNHSMWHASGFPPLEKYINESLDSIERLLLKLRASASVGMTLTEKYISVLSANQAVIQADQATLQDVDNLLRRHEETVRKGYPAHFARADNVLRDVCERADAFFYRHLRVSNMWNLLNRATVEQAFEEEVAKGTHKSVQRQIHGVAEWLADTSSRNLTDTTAVFSRRVGERAKDIDLLHRDVDIERDQSPLAFEGLALGRDMEVTGSRERLVTRLTETAEDLSSQYVSSKEGKHIADKIASSVRLSAGLGLGSLSVFGLHLLNSTSLSSEALFGDPTIPLLAGLVGIAGSCVIPQQRRVLRSEVRNKVGGIRTRMQHELTARLEEQLAFHTSSIRTAIEPFSDFSDEQCRRVDERMQDLSKSLQCVRQLEDKLAAIEDADKETEAK